MRENNDMEPMQTQECIELTIGRVYLEAVQLNKYGKSNFLLFGGYPLHAIHLKILCKHFLNKKF